MASNIILKTWAGSNISAMNDAIVRETTIPMNGILKGCDITYSSGNIIHIAAGYGIIKGRLFEIFESDLQVTLPITGSLPGRIYIRMDLSNIENPIEIKTFVGENFPDLVQDDDANYTNGIYEIEIATFTAGTVAITDIKFTGTNIAGLLSEITMLVNGFVSSHTEFSEDGSSMTQTSNTGTLITDFSKDGLKVTKVLTDTVGNKVKLVTTFDASGLVIDSVASIE